MRDGQMGTPSDTFDLIIRGLKKDLEKFGEERDLAGFDIASRIRTLFDDDQGKTMLISVVNRVLSLQSTVNDSTMLELDKFTASLYCPLVVITSSGYEPVFGNPIGKEFRTCTLQHYWEDEKVISIGNHYYSRKVIVKTVANKAGPSHFDEKNLSDLQKSLLQDGLGVRGADGKNLKNFLTSVLAQIAYEVITSIDPSYKNEDRRPKLGIGAFIKFESRDQAIVSGAIKLKGNKRNTLCPCGSGRKYKNCHLPHRSSNSAKLNGLV